MRSRKLSSDSWFSATTVQPSTSSVTGGSSLFSRSRWNAASSSGWSRRTKDSGVPSARRVLGRRVEDDERDLVAERGLDVGSKSMPSSPELTSSASDCMRLSPSGKRAANSSSAAQPSPSKSVSTEA